MSHPLRAMVVDDSVVMRNLVAHMIEEMPGVEVAGRAINGRLALQKLPAIKPDVIILDLEMPEMNGIQFLEERRERGIDIPVVILSSVAHRGARITMEALHLGASDFVLKPTDDPDNGVRHVAEQLQTMIRVYGSRYRVTSSYEEMAPVTPQPEAIRPSATVAPPPLRIVPRSGVGPLTTVAIGISTGGPNALREVLAGLDASFPAPVLVVQHMPPAFTYEFAASLDRICALEVKEAEEDDVVKPGRIFIAPGDFHMSIESRSLARVIRLRHDSLVSGHRPSADVLFKSVAAEFGRHALAVIMTGMGRDGAEGIREVLRAGGVTVAQDAASSIVFGMPRVAIETGAINFVVSLHDMAKRVTALITEPAKH